MAGLRKGKENGKHTYCHQKVGPVPGRWGQWHPCLFLEPAVWWILSKCWWWQLGMVWKISYHVMRCWSPSLSEIHSMRDPLCGMLRLLQWRLFCVEIKCIDNRAKSLNGSYSSLDFVTGKKREDYGRNQQNMCLCCMNLCYFGWKLYIKYIIDLSSFWRIPGRVYLDEKVKICLLSKKKNLAWMS